MIPIRIKNGSESLDDLSLHKLMASQKICDLLSFVKENQEAKPKGLVKTASTENNNAIIELFTKMLGLLNLKLGTDDSKMVLEGLSKADSLTKESKKKSSERKDDIKIASKKIKDSHYQIDLSKDVVAKDGKKIFMVSCYARDAYLGRYLIKRNFFFNTDREEFADSAYDEILVKVAALKDRYYNDIIDVSEIFAQIKKTLDGVVSEIKMEEDSIATTVSR